MRGQDVVGKRIIQVVQSPVTDADGRRFWSLDGLVLSDGTVLRLVGEPTGDCYAAVGVYPGLVAFESPAVITKQDPVRSDPDRSLIEALVGEINALRHDVEQLGCTCGGDDLTAIVNRRHVNNRREGRAKCTGVGLADRSERLIARARRRLGGLTSDGG